MPILFLSGLLGLITAAPSAQRGERFRGRRSILPVDLGTARMMSGSGVAFATLTGTFEGLSSPAIVDHTHQAPPARRGPVAFTIAVSSATSGEVSEILALNDT